jgi:transcriptional regulator with XRE-family HTH domain
MCKWLNKTIGFKICKERRKKKITQEQLAFKSFVDKTYLARIEGGRANPSVKVLYKISRCLRMRLCDLFCHSHLLVCCVVLLSFSDAV